MCSFCAASAQDSYDFPEERKFFQRNRVNTSTLNFSASLKSAAPDSMKVIVLNNNQSYFQKLYQGNSMSDSLQLNAGLNSYDFKVFIYQNGAERLFYQSQRILCGDTYLIYGQSNAVAFYYPETLHPYVDFSYIYNFVYLVDGDVNNGWHTADFYVSNPGAIGIWFAKNIVENEQMPVQLINGAVGGKPLQELAFRDNLDPFNRQNPYGNFISRIRKSGVKSLAGLIFLQGEFESYSGDEALVDKYKYHLNALFSNISRDLSLPLNDIFLVQTNLGNDLKTSKNASRVRDIQRQVADSLAAVHAFSSMDLPMISDGVHYSFTGYKKIASDMAKAADYFIYKQGVGISVTGPLIQEIRHIENEGKISLVFDAKQRLSVDSVINFGTYSRYLQDVLFDQNGEPFLDSIRVDKNILHVFYDSRKSITEVTYMPGAFSDNFSNTYDGPLIKNISGMPALSFLKVKVTELNTEACTTPPLLRPQSIVKVFDKIYLQYATDTLQLLKSVLLDVISSTNQTVKYQFDAESLVIDLTDNDFLNEDELDIKFVLLADFCDDITIKLPIGKCRNLSSKKIAFKGYDNIEGCSIVLRKLIDQKPLHLKSQSFILLEPGFSANGSGTFTAEIVP